MNNEALRHHNNAVKMDRRRSITTLREALSALLSECDPIPRRRVLAALRAQGHHTLAEAPRSTPEHPVLTTIMQAAMQEEGIRALPYRAATAELFAPGESATNTNPRRHYYFLTRRTDEDIEQHRRALWAMR